MSKTKKKTPASLVWFEIAADNLPRAKTFYSKLFGWKIKAVPGMKDYLHIDTDGPDGSPDGGIIGRMAPAHSVTNYIGVDSVDKYCAKVKKLGGTICKPKTTIPTMGHFAICVDPEKNTFAVWERDPKAK